ncbi:MAG: MFS transporter [Candidatus Thorarchaeota archaeon]|nr:MFS transporter [Candidatus Thorarchaeota archaeon]
MDENNEVSDLAEEESAEDQTLTFGAASFLNDMSSDMIAPIWPTFLNSYLGLSYLIVGFIDGLALTITSLSKLGAGYLSDRTGKRKSFIEAGYFLSMISRIGFAFSRGFLGIAIAKSMDRLGKIRGPPRDAMVAGEVKQKQRGKAFGILRAMDSAGALAGAIIAFLLFSYLGYIGIILLATFPAACSVIIISVLIKEKRGKDVFKGVSFRNLNRDLKLFFLASTLFALATFSYSFLILFAQDYYTVYILPLLYIIFTLSDAVSAYPFGVASDRFGRKPILILGFLFLALTSAWAHFANDWLTIIPLFALFGLSAGALTPVQTTLVADLVEPERRASIIGAFQMVIGVAALPAGLVIGYLWETFGSLIAFDFSLIMAFIAILIMMLIRVKEPSDGQITSSGDPQLS